MTQEVETQDATQNQSNAPAGPDATEESVLGGSEEQTPTDSQGDGQTRDTQQPTEPNAQPTPTAAGDYTLSLPMGTRLEQEALTDMASFASESGLSQDQAQQVLELASDTIDSFQEATEEKWKQQVNTWGSELRANSEYGGDKFPESVQLVKQAVLAFFPQGTMDMLNKTGHANNPMVFEGLLNIGKRIQEGSLVTGGTSPTGEDLDDATLLFGDVIKKE
jgi:hypothetical protein